MSLRSEIHRKNLEKIFYPESIAIVGANRVAGTVPCDILLNIFKADFNGVVFPVSPKEKSIGGVKTYKYILEIPDPVDLAILVFPSSVCHMALEQCGQKGIKSVVVISAGFKETGTAGLDRELQLKAIAEKYGMSFIGPNCLGVINTDQRSRLNASFARKMPDEGSIAFLSQSGALCTAVLDYARAKHIGFSKFVSFGNKADISEIDLLYYLADDPKTSVILLYLEEISDGPALMKAARDIMEKTGKPILALKSGRTSEGASAAASHTGSLAGSDDICDAAFRQAGIIRCGNIEEMFSNAIAFAYQPAPKGNRVAIITNAGGPGVLTTDATIKAGLTLSKLSDETTRILKKGLPATANTKNPIDVIGDARADRYNIALSSALTDPGVDGAFVILTPQSMTDIGAIAREVCTVSATSTKPVYASFMGQADVAEGIDILERHRIPHYTLPESMAGAFACVHAFANRGAAEAAVTETSHAGDRDKARAVLDEAIQAGRHFLPELEATAVLQAYGLPTLPNGFAQSEKEAAATAERLGCPVVMKIVSDDIIHKSDAKGVTLGIKSGAEAAEAFAAMMTNVKRILPDAKIKGVLIQPMLAKGEEVILGVKRDPAFGAVIMFGLGGIFVETFKDVSFRVAPMSGRVAESMIKEVKSYKILAGARGRPVMDIEAIRECIVRLGRLAIDCPQIAELDINPLIVHEKGKGCFVADARIMV